MRNTKTGYTQEIEDALANMPELVRETILNADIKSKLRELAKAHSLHYDKWIDLEDEILKALVGITDPNDLPKNIMEATGLSFDKTARIMEAVMAIVFDPIQDRLRDEIGGSQSTLEQIDTTELKTKEKIDISKFTNAPTDPSVYTPKAKSVNKKTSDDPYLEPIE